MSNPWGRLGAPMVQPTKDELRQWLYEARQEAETQRSLRRLDEYKLKSALELLGQLALDGRIEMPLEKLGELVLKIASEQKIREAQKLLTE